MKVNRNMFSVVMVVLLFAKIKGQCMRDGDEVPIKSCNGSTRSGSIVTVDFSVIGRPCTCTVNSSFVGQLLVTTRKVNFSCTTELILTKINERVSFDCNQDFSDVTNVTHKDKIIVEAGYKQGVTSGIFHQCTRFQENGGKGGIVSVQCGGRSDTTKGSGMGQLIFNVKDSSAANDPDNIKYIVGGTIAGGFVVIVVCIFTIANRKRLPGNKHKEMDYFNSKRRDSPASNITTHTDVSQSDGSGYNALEKKNLGFPSTEPEPIPKSSNGCNAPAPKKSHKIIFSL